MAAFGGLGKALGLGSTKEVLGFGANAAASYFSGGAIPLQTTPFEQPETQQMNPFELQSRNIAVQNARMPAAPSSGGGFFGNLGQSIGNIGRGVGGFFENVSPALNFFGVGGGGSQGAQGPARTIQMRRPEETASSGEILGANLGIGSLLFQGGKRLIQSPVGQGLIGGAVGTSLVTSSGGQTGGVRITRKMKADVRRMYNMTMGNPSLTADVLNQMGTYPRLDFDAALVFFILTKRFRNDGPVVTKAAVRKTRTTLRRMKGVVDMYNSVCKAPARRAPMRRASKSAVQLIKN